MLSPGRSFPLTFFSASFDAVLPLPTVVRRMCNCGLLATLPFLAPTLNVVWWSGILLFSCGYFFSASVVIRFFSSRLWDRMNTGPLLLALRVTAPFFLINISALCTMFFTPTGCVGCLGLLAWWPPRLSPCSVADFLLIPVVFRLQSSWRHSSPVYFCFLAGSHFATLFALGKILPASFIVRSNLHFSFLPF